MTTPTPDLIDAAARIRADAETVAAAAERLVLLHGVCSEVRDWLRTHRAGDLPELTAMVARLSSVLDD